LFSGIDIFLGSVAMLVGCGGIFNYHYGTDLLIVMTNMVLSKLKLFTQFLSHCWLFTYVIYTATASSRV